MKMLCFNLNTNVVGFKFNQNRTIDEEFININKEAYINIDKQVPCLSSWFHRQGLGSDKSI